MTHPTSAANQWAPPPTVPAKFGKIGFWLLVGSVVVSILSSIASVSFLASATSSWSSEEHPIWIAIITITIGVASWMARVAATAFGIVGLARRERPVWWSIVAICAIPITWLISIAMFFVTMIFMAANSGF